MIVSGDPVWPEWRDNEHLVYSGAFGCWTFHHAHYYVLTLCPSRYQQAPRHLELAGASTGPYGEIGEIASIFTEDYLNPDDAFARYDQIRCELDLVLMEHLL